MSNENNLVSDIAENVEAAAEAAEGAAAEAVSGAEEAVADVAEEVTGAAEEAAAEAAETATEAAENAAEAVEEKAADVKEAAEEAVAEAPKKAAAEVKKSGNHSAVRQPDIIKKKKGVNRTTLIAVIVCAVIVLACVAFVGWRLGWFHVPVKNSMTMDDYSTIEIYSSEVEVTDSTIDSYLSSMQTHYNTTENITEGTVEEGDKIHIVYTGYKDGEAFDGGSTGDAGTDITVGSSGYIDGFDDGLIGVKVGDTVDLNLTFPEVYENSPDLAGQDVVFTVTVEHKVVTNTPDLTDEFIKENSADYTQYYYGETTQIDTLDEYRTFVHDKLYDSYYKNAVETSLLEKVHVKTFDENYYETQLNYHTTVIGYYAQMYGMDADTFASYYGYDTAAAYAEGNTKDELTRTMMYEKLGKDLGITFTQEEIDASIQEFMDEQDVADQTVEEFKESNGEYWLYSYVNYTMTREPVIEALEDRVVIVEGERETEAPETEAETEVETAAEGETEVETEAETEAETETAA